MLTARLYPLNAQANTGGLLTAVVVDNHTGRGAFTLACLGDTPQGEATRVDANCAAFLGHPQQGPGLYLAKLQRPGRHCQRVRHQRRERAM